MKNLALILIAILTSVVGLATNYSSAGSGNWNSSSTWSPSGVPGAGDAVTISPAHTVTVTANAACASLVMNNKAAVAGATTTKLIINVGYALTVSGNITQNVTVSGLSTAGCQIDVLGTLNCQGNFTQNHSLLALLGGANALVIGNATNSGTVNITGTFTQQNGLITALGIANSVSLRQGVLNIDGTVTFVGGLLNLVSTNVIEANDNGSYDGKVKRFYMGGNFAGNNYGQVVVQDSNGNADYDLILDGTIQQTISVSNKVYKKLLIENISNETILEGNLLNTNLLDSLVIKSGAILNIGTSNLDAITAFVGQIKIDSNGTLKIQDENGVPAQKIASSYVLMCHPKGIIEFNSASSLNVLKENYNYPVVKLTGSGTKVFYSSSDIDNSLLKIGELQLVAGTFEWADNKKFKLNSTYGTKKFIQSANTTFKVLGDYAELDAYFDLNRNSTINYAKNGTQTIYQYFKNDTLPEPYGILALSRNSGTGEVVKNILASTTIKVKNKVAVNAYANLVINQSALLELQSDVTYTAYIGEIASTGLISYSGTPAGRVLANKFITLPNDNYRDFSSPVKLTTIKNLERRGITLVGIPGSNYPKLNYTNAFYYNEPNGLMLDSGWVSATNASNPVHKLNGSGQITSGAWRIYAGKYTQSTNYTLKDTGQVYQGDVAFLTTFTHTVSSRNLDDGWNMIGNPYTSAINWGKVYRDPANSAVFAANGIQPTIYAWRPSDQGNPIELEDSYTFYNASTGVGSGLDSIIPSFQGFWVKTYNDAAASADYVLTVKESHKQDVAASNFFKSDAPKPNVVEIQLAGANHTDKIWFHAWPEATVGRDEVFDVQRFARDTSFPSVNFVANEESMQVWVNAIPQNNQYTELPLFLSTPQQGTYTLKMKNFEAFVQEMGCITVIDLLDGKIVDLTGDKGYTFTSPTGFNATRFMLYIYKPIEDKIVTSNASCFGEQGKLVIDLKGIANDVSLTLYKEGQYYKNYTGQFQQITSTLPVGNYELASAIGLISCTSNRYGFVIEQPKMIVAKFNLPSGYLKKGDEVTLSNNSENASSYLWTFPNSTTSEEQNPSYTFNESGLQTISLKAMGADTACYVEQQRVVEVGEATGITGLKDAGIAFNQNSTSIVFQNVENYKAIRILTIDGKVVYEEPIANAIFELPIAKANRILLIQFIDGKNGLNFKIQH